MTTEAANWHRRWFALIEFKLLADTPAKVLAVDDTPEYECTGHDNYRCPAIKEKRTVSNTSLAGYLTDHENFDGELRFSDPWPCKECIKAPTEDPLKREPTTPMVRTPLKPYRTSTTTRANPKAIKEPNAPATDAQVRMLMVLYRRKRPESSKEALKAAEERARAMTKQDTSNLISAMQKELNQRTA